MTMLWHIEIEPAPGHPDHVGERLAHRGRRARALAGPWSIRASRGFLIEGDLSEAELDRVADEVLRDPVVEAAIVRPAHAPDGADAASAIVHVLPKPGVTDPEAESALALLRDLGYAVSNVRTIRTYRIDGPAAALPRLIQRVLANDAVEQAVVGPLPFDRLGQGQPYHFRRVEVPIRGPR